MAMELNEASEVYRGAMRDTIKRYWFWYVVEGALLVLAGIVAILSPLLFSVLAVIMLGWVLIISGVIHGVRLLGSTKVPHFWLQLVSAVLAIWVGYLFLRQPANSLLIITMMTIVFFMIDGVTKVIFAFTIRPLPNWYWVLASGLIAIALSVYLWNQMPVTAVWLVGVLLGIELISNGVSTFLLAWQYRDEAKTAAA
jgi:uncharacterized membrane protein HdeD (DUF308 family)